MPDLFHPARNDAALASALGRFAQAASYLEAELIMTLTRLLPVGEDMGRLLFAGNQMRRNIELLKTISKNPSVPLSERHRKRIDTLCGRAIDANDDRSRLLHNRIFNDQDSKPGEYSLFVERNDGSPSIFYKITIDDISRKTVLIENVIIELATIPRPKFSLENLLAMRGGTVEKEYPPATRQVLPRLRVQKSTGRLIAEDDQTTKQSRERKPK